jgi:transporter family-2 protein
MYLFLSLLTGFIIAVMVAVNGVLTLQHGIFLSAIIIHIVGTVFAYMLIKITKKTINIPKNLPIWMFTGGIIGVLTTFFNNFAFGKISMTSIVALGLFGQSALALIIDTLGLYGMKKQTFKKSSMIGIIFSSIGILVMLDSTVGTALYAVVLSFLAGITVVLSRTVNAELSRKIGELQGSLINHVAGLPITIIIAVLFLKNNLISSVTNFSPHLWIYLGGTLGVITVMLFNITVPKVSAFQLTLLSFVGQVFTGIAIDMITKGSYTKGTFAGGIIIAMGIAVNLIYEKVMAVQEAKKLKYLERIDHAEKQHWDKLLSSEKNDISSDTLHQRETECENIVR